MAAKKQNSREKILDAVKAVARDSGFGNLSLDAIAARAGVSKGGLLYNFPTKAALMRALVEDFIADFETELDEHAHGGRGELVSAYVRIFSAKYDETEPEGVGLLAAIAEDPDFRITLIPDKIEASGKHTEDRFVRLLFIKFGLTLPCCSLRSESK